MQTMHIVSAILRRDNHIVMVQQPDENSLYWFIPGGVMEANELPLDALRREVREETGLAVNDGAALAYVTYIDSVLDAQRIVAFAFEVTDFSGSFTPDDPDQLTHDVAFVPLADAIQRLDRTLWLAMRQPLQAYLRGECAAASLWQYRQHTSRDFDLLYKTP